MLFGPGQTGQSSLSDEPTAKKSNGQFVTKLIFPREGKQTSAFSGQTDLGN